MGPRVETVILLAAQKVNSKGKAVCTTCAQAVHSPYTDLYDFWGNGVWRALMGYAAPVIRFTTYQLSGKAATKPTAAAIRIGVRVS